MSIAVEPTASIRQKLHNLVPGPIWAIALLAVIVRVIHSIASGYTSEDFLITLRYADNLAAGHGFVYNPGEHALGTTTPAYALILAAIRWLNLPPIAIGKALNILADGALCVAVYRWLAAMGQRTSGLIAALFLALNPISVRWSISGMETSLVTLFGVLALIAYAEKRNRAMFALLAVLFWLRWDSLLLAGTLTVAVTMRDRRLPWREVILFAVIVAPWLLFATYYFGSPIPTTAAAKMAVYGWRAHGTRFPELGRIAYRFGGNAAYASLTACALFGAFWAVRRKLWPLAPAVVWFVIYFAAFLYSRALLFEWYLAPPLPVYAGLIGLGLAHLKPAKIVIPRPMRVAGWCAVAVAALGVNIAVLQFNRNAQLVEENLRIPLGIWLRENSAPNDRIMLEPIGYIGYFSQRRILDTVGLVSPEVIAYWREPSVYPMFDLALAFRPDWVVLRPGELDHVHDAARAANRPWEDLYESARTFSYSRPGKEDVTFIVFKRRPGGAR